MKSRVKSSVSQYFFFILLFISLLFISFQLLLITPFVYNMYYGSVYEMNIEPYELFESAEQASANSDVFLHYLAGKTDKINLPITNEEYIHMSDVKLLYEKISGLAFYFVVSFIWLLCFLLLQRKTSLVLFLKKHQKKAIRTHIGFYVIIVTTLLFFKKIFIFLHTVFFTNDLWLLPYNSITIQTFPQSFFIFFFICTILLTSLLYWSFNKLVPAIRQHS